MFEGSYVALVTPFYPDGSVNYEKLRGLCRWHLQNETDGIVVLGTTGESSTMTHEEDETAVRCVLDEVNGRIPVVAGSGSNCTETMVMKSVAYEKLGVDALLTITPYYNKANAKGMYRHFAAVAEKVHTPIILYNVPGRTGCSLPVDCVEALSKLKNVRAIKEASGNISYTAKVARLVNDEFELLSGNDDMVLPVLSLGGTGVISVFANICPRQSHQMVDLYLTGERERALEIQLKYLDLISNLFIEVNPIPVKTAMNLMGMEAGPFRLPLFEMEQTNLEKLKASLRAARLL